ncbi:MAG TPA: SIMPL domain-containing protein [Blastocatellia bacterium]|nr:SIMPL domain-containing protein [Blastocatellia bacterium]
MDKTIGKLFKCFSIIALLSVGALAQEGNRMPPSSIRATGEAVVLAKPDQAQIDIGVLTQAATAKAAGTENARKVDAVIAALRKVLGPAADIKTIGYSLSPAYTYPREGGQPRITGYAASNVVQVKTGDLAQVGAVIDTATQAGANNIQSLQFMLKDDQAVRAQALREAALKAKAKADALASALGLRIVRVLHVEESGAATPPIYAREMAMQAKADVATPVESGNIEVRASVSLTVEIANQ